jgi:hypothetical protein
LKSDRSQWKRAAAFLLNDDTIRGWHKLFEQRGNGLNVDPPGLPVPAAYASRMVLPPPLQSSLPAGWLAFTGRELNPLDRNEGFQITSSSSLPGLFLAQRPKTCTGANIHCNATIIDHLRVTRSSSAATSSVRRRLGSPAAKFADAAWVHFIGAIHTYRDALL